MSFNHTFFPFFPEKSCHNYLIVLSQTHGGGSIPSVASLSPCACLTMLFTLFTNGGIRKKNVIKTTIVKKPDQE